MGEYTAQDFDISMAANVRDTLTILSSPNGNTAWISNKAASIENLELVTPNGKLARMVFGNGDAAHFLSTKENRGREAPLIYTKKEHIAASIQRNKALMSGGVPITFFPGRLQGGQFCFLQSDGSYVTHALPVNNVQSGSLLHFGPGKDIYFDRLPAQATPEGATVTYGRSITLGEVQARIGIKYTLTNEGLNREVTVINSGEKSCTIPMSDHGSIFPGNGTLEDLTVSFDYTGKFELNPSDRQFAKLATGRLIEEPDDLPFLPKGMPVVEDIEAMYHLGQEKILDVINRKSNIGLRITGDPSSKVMYFWNHVTGNDSFQKLFVSPQMYMGQPTAAISAPAFNTPAQMREMHELFKQGNLFRIDSGEKRVFNQSYKAFNQIPNAKP